MNKAKELRTSELVTLLTDARLNLGKREIRGSINRPVRGKIAVDGFPQVRGDPDRPQSSDGVEVDLVEFAEGTLGRAPGVRNGTADTQHGQEIAVRA